MNLSFRALLESTLDQDLSENFHERGGVSGLMLEGPIKQTERAAQVLAQALECSRTSATLLPTHPPTHIPANRQTDVFLL